MSSPAFPTLELQIKKGVDSLEKEIGILFDTQIVFLTRLRKEFSLRPTTTRVYELQKDVSNLLFQMTVALALSTGHLPSLGFARHAMDSEPSHNPDLPDPEAELLFGSNHNSSIKRDIQALTGNRTIKDFRNTLLETVRGSLSPVDEWLSSRDPPNMTKPRVSQHATSDGQELEDNTSTNDTSYSSTQRNEAKRKRAQSQSAGSPETPTQKIRDRIAGNDTPDNPTHNTKLVTKAEKKVAKDIAQNFPRTAAPVRLGEFCRTIQGLGTSALKESKRPKITSNSKKSKMALANIKLQNTSPIDQSPQHRALQSATRDRTPAPPKSLSSSSARRRNLQSSHHSNDSATDRSRHAAFYTPRPTSEQTDASNYSNGDEGQAEPGDSTRSAHKMFFSESPSGHQEGPDESSDPRPD